jgi:hypothetical protein
LRDGGSGHGEWLDLGQIVIRGARSINIHRSFWRMVTVVIFRQRLDWLGQGLILEATFV